MGGSKITYTIVTGRAQHAATDGPPDEDQAQQPDAPKQARHASAARWRQLAVLAAVVGLVASGAAWLANEPDPGGTAQAAKAPDETPGAKETAAAAQTAPAAPSTTAATPDTHKDKDAAKPERTKVRPRIDLAAASLVPGGMGERSAETDFDDYQVRWPVDIEYSAEPVLDYREVSVDRGDTLMGVLLDAGISRGEANATITALGDVFDPRRLRAGQDLSLTFGLDGSAEPRFMGMRFDTAPDRFVEVARADESFEAKEVERVLKAELRGAAGEIDSSLYAAGYEQGLPPAVIVQLIKVYSFSVDFQRDIRSGDSFEVMYEDHVDEDGKVVRQSDILYAELTIGGEAHRLWRFEPESGNVDYFNEKGESVRRMLMRTPIDGARLSSNYGMRRHPILGYSRMHTGTDFAAPRGTPIYASGNGTVVFAGRKGGYGNFVKIRHNGSYHTAYAHMKGFAKGIRKGARVSQGETIGYVGTTGRSTGPHLHYEVEYNGKRVNPMALELPTGEKLEGADLAQFQAARTKMERQFAKLRKGGGKLEVAATANDTPGGKTCAEPESAAKDTDGGC